MVPVKSTFFIGFIYGHNNYYTEEAARLFVYIYNQRRIKKKKNMSINYFQGLRL